MTERICAYCNQPANPQRGRVLTHSNGKLRGDYHDQCFTAVTAAAKEVPAETLPGSWPMLFDAVHEHITGPERTLAIVKLYEAVKYLVDACPDDNAVQLAARRAGMLVSDADDGNSAVQMVRTAALIELMQESQREKGSVTAYKRVQKALRTLGIDSPHAINLVLYTLSYHTREGEPYEWLAKKLAAKKVAK